MGDTVRERRLSQLGWALYQLAASPYFVIINIFVFAAYFQKHVIGDNVEGQVVWGYTQATAGDGAVDARVHGRTPPESMGRGRQRVDTAGTALSAFG